MSTKEIIVLVISATFIGVASVVGVLAVIGAAGLLVHRALAQLLGA